LPRFFFAVKDGITIKDPTGSWCRDEAEARDKAIVIAARVGQVEEGLPAPARHISIRDEAGREVDTVSVRDGARPIKPGEIRKPGR
jgi:hypothetical protein